MLYLKTVISELFLINILKKSMNTALQKANKLYKLIRLVVFKLLTLLNFNDLNKINF
jgi:hypothetical protein